MSQRLLMNATRDLLRLPVGAGTRDDGFGFTVTQCEVMFDGQPMPVAGELFIAVHEGEWTGEYEEEGRGDTMGVYITITRRVSFVPKDRGRIPLNDAADALNLWADRIASKLHGNYAVIGSVAGGPTYSANYLLGGTVNGFVRPLYFKGAMGPSQPKGPDWFSSDNDSDAPVGVARTLIFTSRETRWQTHASQT